MNEKTREEIALFRYGLIAPLFNGQQEPKEYFKQLEGKIHFVPYYGERKVAAKTIQEWLRHYNRNGFEALKPKRRSDKGYSRRLSPDHKDHILEIRKDLIHMPVSVFYEQLIKRGEIEKNGVSYATINRLLKKHGLAGRNHTSYHPTKERKRFAHDKVNMLWQTDLSHGPYIPINKKMKKTFLIAYIDDCSRLVPHAQFFTSEKFDSLREVTKEALIRRGKPTIIYADNGKIYRSETLQYACAQLGITLAHTQPYDPKAKGKIERFFKTVQTRFYPLLKADPVDSLKELNERFLNWLEVDYHRRRHASLDGKTPHQIFQSQLDNITFMDDLSILDVVFLRRTSRKVKLDSTITLEKKLYEVPPEYIGQRIDLRIDANTVYIFEDGQKVAEAIPVIMSDNAHVKRRQTPFAVAGSSKGKGDLTDV